LRSLFQSLFRLIVRHLITLLLIIAVLIAGKLALNTWNEFRSLQKSLPLLSKGQEAVDEHHARLSNEVATDVQRFQLASFTALAARIEDLNRRINELEKKQREPMLSFPFPPAKEIDLAGKAVERAKHAVEIELLKQERDYLMRLHATALGKLNRQAAVQRLQQLWQDHTAIYNTLQANLQAQRALKTRHPVLISIPGTAPYQQMASLQQKNLQLRTANTAAHQAYRTQQEALKSMPASAHITAFRIDDARVNQALQEFQTIMTKASAAHAQNWLAKGTDQVIDVLPVALGILCSLILLPLAGKVLYYFVLAPIAGRLPAIYIGKGAPGMIDLPHQAGMPRNSHGVSSVSQSITVDASEELLVHPEYMQSASSSGKKDTKWLVNWSYPFTCLASGLVAMTRIRPSQPEEVVISSSVDPLDEIALIALPAGAAMVFQPRSLVGFKSPKNYPVTIHRHWRIASLHAWLTLQFRYLVFTGPVTLIVKGCRGVRIEAAGGRSISQYATLGFSANVGYSTIRSEPFVPYLTSKQALFHDRFEGNSGIFVYQETPRIEMRQSAASRGSEAVLEAMLKAVGI
jgi:hypothetical protein